jgi:hypothetical protein
LSLNPDKSEAIVLGTGARQRSEGLIGVLTLGGTDILPTASVKSLGVTIDSTLSFNTHVDNMGKAAYLHIRALRHISKQVSENAAASIASSVVGARLDYCNSVLYGVAKGNIHKLQRVQNTLARIVTGTNKYDDIKLILACLHWLPIASRIDYKVTLLTFKAVTSKQPEYISELVHFNIPTRQLRSSSRNLLQARLFSPSVLSFMPHQPSGTNYFAS